MQKNKNDHKRVEEAAIVTTEKVNEILYKEEHALKLSRGEKLWFNGQHGVRRKGIKFAMTPEELDEYIKCKLSIYYFAEHYCKIKLDDGTVGQMKLRDYQEDILRLYTENRYSILMASRQIGKCFSYDTVLNIKDKITNEIYKVCIGRLYYEEISKVRKLTYIEKIKTILYYILEKIN
jgi:hypothetical protein